MGKTKVYDIINLISVGAEGLVDRIRLPYRCYKICNGLDFEFGGILDEKTPYFLFCDTVFLRFSDSGSSGFSVGAG